MRRLLPYIYVAMALSLPAFVLTWALMQEGRWYYGAQAYRYLYLLQAFREAIDAGILYPRWLPELMGGYGYPTFLFYQPGFFYFSLPFTYLFSDYVHALTASVLAMLFVGGLGVYRLCRLWCGSWIAATCSLLFMLTPYVPFLLYARGSVSELWGMLLCPWVAYFIFRLQEEWRQQALSWCCLLGLSCCVAALIVSHPFICIYMLVTAAFLLLRKRCFWQWHYMGVVAACMLLALALSGSYWVTVLQLYHDVSWGRAHRIVTMEWPQLLFLGAGNMVLAIAVLISMYKQPFIRSVAVYIMALIYLLGPWGESLWSHPLIAEYTSMLQMTYRALTVISLLLIIMIAQGFARITATWPVTIMHRAAVGSIAVIALFISYGVTNNPWDFFDRKWPTHMFDYAKTTSLFQPTQMHDVRRLPKGWTDMVWLEDAHAFGDIIRSSAHNMTHTDEFFPHGIAKEPLPNRFTGQIPPVQADGVSYNGLTAPHRIIFEYTMPSQNKIDIRINQYSFPGWRVQMDGKDIPYKVPAASASDMDSWYRGDKGLIYIHVQTTGTHHFTVWYDGPPHSRSRNIILLLCAGAAVMAMYRLKTRHGHVRQTI